MKRSYRIWLGLYWLGAVAVFVSLVQVAYAQPVAATDPIPRVVFPTTQVGNITKLGPLTVDAANAAKFSFGAAANGAVFANSNAYVPTAGGASIPLTVGTTIAKPSVAKAIGKFAAKIGPWGYAVSVGSGLYDLANELGFDASNKADGSLQVLQRTSTVVGSYYITGFSTGLAASTRTQACINVLGGGAYVSQSGPGWYCYSSIGGGGYGVATLSETTVNGTTPSTPAALETAIGAKTDYVPSTSALPRAVLDAIKSGESLAADPDALAGPSTSPGPESVTHVGPNTVTNITTNNHTYSGANVTTTTTNVITTVNTSTGDPVSVVTDTGKPVPAEKAITCGLPGTPSCKIDESGTPLGDQKQGQSTLNAGFDALGTALGGGGAVGSTAGKDTGWGLTPYWLAGGNTCVPSVLWTLPATLGSTDISIDLCPHLPKMYAVMNFLWVVWTFLATINMVFAVTTGAKGVG